MRDDRLLCPRHHHLATARHRLLLYLVKDEALMDCHDEMRHEHELSLARAKHDDEMYHALETWCPYEEKTGDPKWVIRCRKDGRYATQQQCDRCKEKRNA